MQPNSLLLVDINVIGIASIRTYANRKGHFKGNSVGAIAGVLDKLLPYLAGAESRVPVVLWDDRCYWREQIYPAYKRHRWQSDAQRALLNDYLAQVAIIRQILEALGVLQLSCTGTEADDLAGLICRGVSSNCDVLLLTSDTDWYQALQSNVSWFCPGTKRHIALDDLSDAAKVRDGPFDSPRHFVSAKAVAGDPSDGIPGVRGVGLRTAARIIREHGSIDALWSAFDSGASFRDPVMARVAGRAYRDTYRRNLMLIDWCLAPPLPHTFELKVPFRSDARVFEILEASGITPRWTLRNLKSHPAMPTVAMKLKDILMSAART